MMVAPKLETFSELKVPPSLKRPLRREWRVPQPDWLPLGKAVLRFGMNDDPREQTEDQPLVACDEKEGTDEPRPVREIVRVLCKETTANEVKIDLERGTFSFLFHSAGCASVVIGTPWQLANPRTIETKLDPKIAAEALFADEGLTRIPEEQAVLASERAARIRWAVGLVWRQFILGAFDRLVGLRRVTLYARTPSGMAAFQPLPANLWPVLEILDWDNALAHDPQRNMYFDIHAATFIQRTAKDENGAIRELTSYLTNHPDAQREDAVTWLEQRGFQVSGRGFQARIWPRAREKANLSVKAKPGRKPISKQT